MRLFVAFKALYHALVSPQRIREAQTGSAAAVFAVAVLLVTAAETGVAYIHAAIPNINSETSAIVMPGVSSGQQGQPSTDANNQSIALSNKQREFTAIMGGALLETFFAYIVLTALALGVARFLTDRHYSVSIVIICVAAASSIDIVKLFVETPLHMVFQSVRYGIHAGVFVDPVQSPLLFSWLQRIDLFSIWYYMALAIGMTTWEGLDKKYGFVVAIVLFTIVQTVFAALTFIAWIMTGGL